MSGDRPWGPRLHVVTGTAARAPDLCYPFREALAETNERLAQRVVVVAGYSPKSLYDAVRERGRNDLEPTIRLAFDLYETARLVRRIEGHEPAAERFKACDDAAYQTLLGLRCLNAIGFDA